MNRLPDITNLPRDQPRSYRRFYSIEPREDGLVDVYVAPVACTYDSFGICEFGMTIRVVRGVEPWDGLEDDIRARYNSWCESGEVIDL
ncbi:MAG: hypothetical protein IJV91_03125 [Kiritimatiellae bacterium]|nr:hypothetical protein [Kiritimatiellia bacterium]